MIYEQRKQERQALIDHLLTQDWNVFGTLKFVNGRTIGRSSADKLLRSYWNRIDRMFFGKAAERQNMRVPRWCFAHEGSDHENYHVHFVVQSPLQNTQSMCCLLNAEWFHTTRQAQVAINVWLRQYNQIRPHHALNMRPPAPETLLEKPKINGRI